MKTTTQKIFVCAAALALLTIARAQNPDNGQTPPDNGGTQNQQPNVIYVPVPVESGGVSNGASGMPQPTDSGNQPSGAQVVQPGQSITVQPGQSANPNYNRNQNYQYRQQGQGRGFDRGQRRGGRDRNSSDMQPLSANTDASAYTPPVEAGTNGTGGLYLNFRNAPIDEVLNYLSDACGFIIELDVPVHGTVDVWSATPVSKDEAVQLLNSVLSRNGYALVQEDRILRVMRYEDAKLSGIPVVVETNIYDIPRSAKVVTQIIPIRYVPARQLLTDLSPLISPTATILANDAGNSIIVTDSEENIRHLAEIIQDIDSSAEDVTEVQVFPLQYHDPTEVANMITQVFSDQSNGQNGGGQTPIRFGGGLGGGGFPGFGGGGGAAGGTENDRIRQHAHVAAVADPRTQSVLVTAPKDMMDEIRQLIEGIDHESPKVPHETVVAIQYADPAQVQKALQDFAITTSRSTGQNQLSALMNRENQNANSTSSSSSFGTTGSGFGGGGFGGGGFGGGGGGFGGGGFGGGGFRGGGQ